MAKLKCNNSNIFNNPYVLMLIILILWGTFAGISKITLRSINSLQMQFYLFLTAFLEMTGICVYNGKLKELKSISRSDMIKLTLFSIPSFLYYIFYLLALMLIPAVEASMLNYLYPMMIVIFAVPINKERLDMNKIISLVIGFAGVIIILTNGSIKDIKPSNIAGDLLAIGAALSWGIFSNLGKRNKVDTVLSNYVFTTVTFLLSTVAMLAFSKFAVPDTGAFLGILWLGTSNIVLSYYLWFKALKSAPSALIASISFITPFVSLFFIMVMTGEKISLTQIAGLIVILLGTALQSFKEMVKRVTINRCI